MTKSRLAVCAPVCALTLAVAMKLAGCATQPTAEVGDVLAAPEQALLTPEMVLADLKEGNRRFVAGQSTSFDWMSQARATSTGQYPKAVILSCLDSRVLPEVIFDQGIGDLFVGRVAGNFENGDQLGSMEFATEVAGAKLIVVLGHTSCGAVKGAIDQAQLGNLTAMLQNIEPAIGQVTPGAAGRTSSDSDYVNRVVEENVRQTVADIRRRSSVLDARVAVGSLEIVGGVYDLSTGTVRWLEL